MLDLKFRFHGKCPTHPKYSPERDGESHNQCERCDDLYVIWLYVMKIAAKRAKHFPGALKTKEEEEHAEAS